MRYFFKGKKRMAKKSIKDAVKTRERIIASAIALFSRKGYEHTTFTDIAQRLKMTKGAVYWHFESKEALLRTIVDEALARFKKGIEDMGEEKLSYLKVADKMVDCALEIVQDPREIELMVLLKKRIPWNHSSLTPYRQELVKRDVGCVATFRMAIENDIQDGRVRKDVDPKQIAAASFALWDSLVDAEIAKFLNCDLRATLEGVYDAIWKSIKA